MKTKVRITGKTLTGLLLLLTLAALIICAAVFGIKAAVVMSGSMEPTVPTGSLCFFSKDTGGISAEDIIVFDSGIGKVIHRVVRETEDGYITKGDANESEDFAPVSAGQIEGKYIFHIPLVGFLVIFLWRYFLFVIGLIALLYVIRLLIKRVKEERESGKMQKQ